MRIIKKIAEQIEDEVHGAEEYIKCAIKYKNEYPALAETYYGLSVTEKNHADALHTEVLKIIDSLKMKSEVPQYMVEMWEEEHDEIIEKMSKVKVMIEMYKR